MAKNMEMIQMSINWWMDEQNLVQTESRLLFVNKKEMK